ncbi:MAG: TnpV protein [Clostridia bacterium]|nr:TnpV protein [Clostridia bacterium]
MNNNTNTLPETVFDETNGLTYDLVGDVYLPRLSLSEKQEDIGRFGRQRKRFLKEHKPELYMELALNGSLHAHLAEINKEAIEQIELLTEQLAKSAGVTEALKTSNQLEWIRVMNSCRARATMQIICKIVFK